MLNIYAVSLDFVRWGLPIARKIREHNRDLANQLERSLVSMPLHIAEGSGQAGGNRAERYRTALGSARETRASLETAVAPATSIRSSPAPPTGSTGSSRRS